MVRSRHREPLFLAWTLSDFAMIVVGALVDGGTSSPLAAVFFLPVVFSAISYPSARSSPSASRACLPRPGPIEGGQPSPTRCLSPSPALHRARSAAGRPRTTTASTGRSRASRTDPLTGCLNRRGFEERAEAELARCAGTGGAARSSSCSTWTSSSRSTTSSATPRATNCSAGSSPTLAVDACARATPIGRLGGDEFAVDAARDRRRGGSAALDAHRRGAGRARAVLVGLALFPDDGVESRDLTRKADARLYSAAAAGAPSVVQAARGAGAPSGLGAARRVRGEPRTRPRRDRPLAGGARRDRRRPRRTRSRRARGRALHSCCSTRSMRR